VVTVMNAQQRKHELFVCVCVHACAREHKGVCVGARRQ